MADQTGRTTCLHCQKAYACRPRGLCSGCYYRPGVRDKYPKSPVHGRVGILAVGRGAPEPTAALAGTPEKVAVFAERALKGLSLYHPADAPRDLR